MKQKLIKILSICLVATVALGGAGVYAIASTDNNKEETAVVSVSDSKADDDSEPSKDEMVYVFTGNDGAVKKVVVSDWLKNALNSDKIDDKSDLTDITNVKGDEAFTTGDNGSTVWDAAGKDIYYQGNTDKQIPVDMKITYKLDGKEIAPVDLPGKSGKVTIRFDYTNNQSETVKIDGKDEKMYVPYAMLTGVVLDNDKFTDIEVKNGKLFNDGDKTAVVGIALPSMQDNLNISEDTFEIPDYVEITADVNDFELETTITIATNQVFNNIDVDNVDSADELKDSLGKLTGAMEQLITGSTALSDGLNELYTKSGELVTGVNQLAAGSTQLKNGSAQVDAGVASLQSGAATLSAGLDTLAANNDTLNAGSKQVFDTLLDTATKQLAAAGVKVPALTEDNYATVLDGVIAKVDTNGAYSKTLEAVTQQVEKQRPAVQAKVTEVAKQEVATQVTAAVKEKVTEQVILTATKMDIKTYKAAVAAGKVDAATQKKIETAVEAQLKSDATAKTIEATTAEKLKSAEVSALIKKNTDAQLQSVISQQMASKDIQTKLAKSVSEQAQTLVALKGSLDSYNAFYTGLITYTTGVEQAAAGAEQLKTGTDILKAGTNSLSTGATQLDAGIATLKDSTPVLVDGITQLRDGSAELTKGLNDFNEQGINKLVDVLGADINGIIDRLRATSEISRNYKAFTDISDEMDGQVSFIYRTDAIESDD